ncbi:MAG: hypothetical protein QNL72_00515 [Candidatus Planktophila sp.]
MSFGNLYHDDPVDDRRNRGSSKGISSLLALVLTIFGAGFYLQTTLAANVSLNSGGGIEFGQGSTRTVACSESQSLIITPLSSFTNSAGAGSHKFSSIKVTNIPTACRGQDFTFSAYNNVANSAAQAIFNTSSTRAVVYMKDDDSFEVGIGGTGLSVTTNSASSFTVTFTTPVVTSSAVFNLTVESAAHAVVTYNIGDTGPGGGKIFYVASSPFTCGPGLNLSCSYLEAADGDLQVGKAWSGNTSDLIDPATSSAIGSGYKNTLAMIEQNATADKAGTLSQAYRGGELSDWYLPSINELIQLCKWARGVPWVSDDTACNSATGAINTGIGASGFDGATNYWSSTEAIDGTVYVMFIGNGGTSTKGKSNGSGRSVRPIRAF